MIVDYPKQIWVLLLMVTIPSLCCAGDSSWEDAYIMLKRKDVKSYTGALAKVSAEPIDFDNDYRRGYKVTKVQAGRIGIVVNDSTVWFDKEDVVKSEEAEKYFTSRIRADNRNKFAFFSRGIMRGELGDHDGGIADLTEVIQLDEKNATAYAARGFIYCRKNDLDKALADYNSAIRLNSINRSFYADRAGVLLAKSRDEEAMTDIKKLMQLNPKDPDAYYLRGTALHVKKKFDQAISDYSEAIRLDDKHTLSFLNRGKAWLSKKNFGKALRDFETTVRFEPENCLANAMLSLFLASCPDPKFRNGNKALDLAKGACQNSGWDDPESMGALAASYAELGHFAEAVTWQTNAIKLAKDKKLPYDTMDANRRLSLYQANKPNRFEE